MIVTRHTHFGGFFLAHFRSRSNTRRIRAEFEQVTLRNVIEIKYVLDEDFPRWIVLFNDRYLANCADVQGV